MHSPERPLAVPNDFLALMLVRMAWLCLGGALGGVLLAIITGGESAELPKFNLMVQDAPVLLLLTVGFFISGQWLRAGHAHFRPLPLDRFSGWKSAATIALAAAVIAYAGTSFVTRHFALSMDEFL